jgi:hypothetical protein
MHEPDVGDRLVATADGKVGIGTSSPNQNLSVAGAIETVGPQGGVKFPDETMQTTAATP